MELALQHAINAFAASRRIGGHVWRWRPSAKKRQAADRAAAANLFERFAAYSVLRNHLDLNYDDELGNNIVTGQRGDLGLDAVAFVIGDKLVLTRSDLDERLRQPDAGTAEVKLVFIQATLSESPAEAKVSGLVNGIKAFMKEKGTGRENRAIAERRATKNALMNWLQRNRPGYKPVCAMYLVWAGSNETVKSHLQGLAIDGSADSLSLQSSFSSCTHELLHARDLLGLVQKDKQRCQIELPFVDVARGNRKGAGSDCLVAIVDAHDFVQAAKGPDGKLAELLFYDNVRGEIPSDAGSPGRRMDETLQSDARSEFLPRNNGIVIVVSDFRIDQARRRVTLHDARIINGCQTCHALIRNEAHLSGDVELAVKIVRSVDPLLTDGVIASSNHQNPITDAQFMSRHSYVRRLEMHFDAAREEKRQPALWFERRAGSRAQERESYPDQVVSIEDVMKTFVGAFHERPDLAKALPPAELRQLVPEDVFNHSHDPELYYAGALLLMRCRAFMRTQRGSVHQYPAKEHLAFVTRVLAGGAATWPGMEASEDLDAEYKRLEHDLPGYAARLMAALADEKGAAVYVARAHWLITEAVASLGLPFEADSMRRADVTELIKEKARLASAA